MIIRQVLLATIGVVLGPDWYVANTGLLEVIDLLVLWIAALLFPGCPTAGNRAAGTSPHADHRLDVCPYVARHVGQPATESTPLNRSVCLASVPGSGAAEFAQQVALAAAGVASQATRAGLGT